MSETKTVWHPFDHRDKSTHPKTETYYLVTLNPFLNSYPVVSDFWKSITACNEDLSKFETVSFWEKYGHQVLAWAEMPEPYRPTNPLDMHQDAITARKYALGDPETVKALHIFDKDEND